MTEKNHLVEANIFQYMPEGVILTPYSSDIMHLLQRAFHKLFQSQGMYRVELGYRRRRVSNILRQTTHLSADPMIFSYLRRFVQSYHQVPYGIYTKFYRPITVNKELLHDLDFIYYNGYIVTANEQAANESRVMLSHEVKKIFNSYAAADLIQGKDPIHGDWRLAFIAPHHEVYNVLHIEMLDENEVKNRQLKYRTKRNQVQIPGVVQFNTGSNVLGKLMHLHQDDVGLILPPELAPIQVVIVPIVVKSSQLLALRRRVVGVEKNLTAAGIRYYTDWSPNKPGKKYHYWDKLGVPLRLEIGDEELKNRITTIIDRHTQLRTTVKQGASLVTALHRLLKKLHSDLFSASKERHDNIPHFKPGEDSSPDATLVEAFVSPEPSTIKKIENSWKWQVVLVDIDPQHRGPCILTGEEAPLALLKKLS